MIVDAHLDLAFLAMTGRDLTLGLADVRERETGHDLPTLTFDELRRAGVGLCCGTIFAQPRDPENAWGYEDHAGARAQAVHQLDRYLRWQDDGHIVLLTSGEEIKEHAARWDAAHSSLGVIQWMEGADPLRSADDLPWWRERGLRGLGPAWVTGSRFAGGNGAPAPLTDRGRELMVALRELNVVLDVSHLSDDAFDEATDLQPLVVASHSNARALIGTARHLPDDGLARLRELNGMVGVNLYNMFLSRGWTRGDARPPLTIVGEMAARLAEVVGWDRVGIGSDLDGGFGARELPQGLERGADLVRIEGVLPEEHRAAVMSENWLRWLTANVR